MTAQPQRRLLYQDGEPYAGPERRRRAEDRQPLTSEGRILLEEIKEEMRELLSCKDDCVLSKEFIGSIGHITGELKKAGEGNISRGINKIISVHEKSDEFFTGIEATKSKAWSTLVYGLVLAALGWLGIRLYKG